MEDWTLLIAFFGANLAVAVTGAVFLPGEWYESLEKPPWTPPNWLFGPAWALLYALIAYAGYRFTLDAQPGQLALPLTLYGLQLVFNGAWSVLFFGMKRMDLALIDAVLMFVAIAATMVAFYPVSPLAAVLLTPYLLWVGFATALNYSIVRRNTPAKGVA
ncbi:MAG: TspO/MBR family protein [Pseudomonadota bacterium]